MDQVMELNNKLDQLTTQVQYLTEQAKVAERAREERGELARDLMPIANEVYRLGIDQLEEVQQYVDLGDLLRLLKRLLRNGRNIEAMLDQLEGLMDLLGTVGPLTDAAFGQAVDRLEQFERKGYFMFAREGMQIADRVVTSFGEEDVRRLGENVVLILNTIKDMTQPEILGFVRNTLQIAEREVEKPVDISYGALFSQMRDPAVRRGLALAMRFLRVIGAQAERNGATASR